jgi:hypothetical protein
LSQNGYGAVSTHLGNSGLSDTRLLSTSEASSMTDRG